jgi:hypothetical protein
MCVLLTGCYRAYMPNPICAPYLSRKSKSAVTFSSAFNNWFNLQSAFAVADHVALYAGATFKPGSNTATTVSNLFGEVAPGYYVASSKFYGSGFVGAGWGQAHVVENGSDPFWYYPQGFNGYDSTTFIFYRLFASMSVISRSSFFDLGVLMRWSYVAPIDFHESTLGNDSIPHSISRVSSTWIFEPGMIYKQPIGSNSDELASAWVTLELAFPIYLNHSDLESTPTLAAGLEFGF